MEKRGNSGALRPRWRWIQTVGKWLRSPSTNADQFVVTLLASLAITLIGAAIGSALSLLDVIHLDGRITVPVFALTLGAAIGGGCLVGANLGRRHREPHKPTSNESPLTELEELEAELNATKSELSKFEQKHKALVRLEAYAELLSMTLASDIGQDLDEGRTFLFEPGKVIAKFIGVPVHISVWQIGQDGSGRDRWDPSHWPTHAPHERDDFRVPIDESWVAYTQRQYKPSDVFNLPDIREAIRRGARGADLNSFLCHDFQSVSCCSLFPREDPRRNQPCLIMLAESIAAFSRHEDRLLQHLARVLGLHLRLQRLNRELERGIAP